MSQEPFEFRRFKGGGPKRPPNQGNPSNRSARRRAFREQLWRANPNCFKCGTVTVLCEHVDGKNDAPNRACLIHIHSRFDVERGNIPYGQAGSQIACKKCADQHSRDVQNNVPKEFLHKLAGRYPQEEA